MKKDNDYICLLCKHYHRFKVKQTDSDRYTFTFNECRDCDCPKPAFNNLEYLEAKYEAKQ